MSAHFAVRCQDEKCGHRFGWFGTMLDRPPCPKCGHKPSAEQLARDHARILDEYGTRSFRGLS